MILLINPLEKMTLVARGGTKSTRTVGHYSVEFLFDDVDLPFVGLRFDGNPDGAKKLFYAIKALKASSRSGAEAALLSTLGKNNLPKLYRY